MTEVLRYAVDIACMFINKDFEVTISSIGDDGLCYKVCTAYGGVELILVFKGKARIVNVTVDIRERLKYQDPSEDNVVKELKGYDALDLENKLEGYLKRYNSFKLEPWKSLIDYVEVQAINSKELANYLRANSGKRFTCEFNGDMVIIKDYENTVVRRFRLDE